MVSSQGLFSGYRRTIPSRTLIPGSRGRVQIHSQGQVSTRPQAAQLLVKFRGLLKILFISHFTIFIYFYLFVEISASVVDRR